jgi:hypothetical protein
MGKTSAISKKVETLVIIDRTESFPGKEQAQ